MVPLTPAQERNLRAALAVTNDRAARERIAFAAWTESKALIYANGGANTSHSPGFDTHPQWPATLRRSLELPHDAVGNNGRSVGMFQQIPGAVGGVWGPMVGCMDPTISAKQFYVHLRVTDDPTFTGTLQTPTGSQRVTVTLSDPIAADVLRVQQPLASEALSSNYNASQVAAAKAIVAQLFPTTDDWIIDMADEAALKTYRDQIVQAVHDDVVSILKAPEFRLDEIPKAIWQDTEVEYENQEEGQHAKDTMARSFQATNGQVYRNAKAIADLTAKVDQLIALLTAK